MLAGFADEPTGSPSPERKGALCSPADPTFDGKAFNDLLTTTKTDVGDWAIRFLPTSKCARHRKTLRR